MENIQSNDSIELISEKVLHYCESYILGFTVPVDQYVQPLYTYLPTMLTYIYGSPTTKGWIHRKLTEEQSKALKNLLSIDGSFFQALVKLTTLPAYSYDLELGNLPSDVQRVLISGATNLLSKAYRDFTYTYTPFTVGVEDLRLAATKQNSLLSRVTHGECRVRYNMLQFYLYHFVTAPTLLPDINIKITRQTPGGFQNSEESEFVSDHPHSRSIITSLYHEVLLQYLETLIPIKHIDMFPTVLGSFFLDILVEFWIRVPWIAPGQKLNPQKLHFLGAFIQYVVSQDLKKCFFQKESLMYRVYSEIKEELYMLISRLAHNWAQHDDFGYVIRLWAMWAAPWRLGTDSSNGVYTPISDNWSSFIFENIPFYTILIEMFLLRCSTFCYGNSEENPAIISQLPYCINRSTAEGQLSILDGISHAINAKGLVDILGLIEEYFEHIRTNPKLSSFIPTVLSIQCFGSNDQGQIISIDLKDTYNILISLNGGSWVPKGVYTDINQHRLAHHVNILCALDYEVQNIPDTSLFSSILNKKEREENSNKKSSFMKTSKLYSSAFKVKVPRNYRSTLVCAPKLFSRNAEELLDSNKPVNMGGEEFIRSYEQSFLVNLSNLLDFQLNLGYDMILPESVRPTFLPKKITTRPFATTVNFIYLLLLSGVMLYAFSRVSIKLK